MRWFAWLSFLLLAAIVGWFWLLSLDLQFTRVDQPGPAGKTAPGDKGSSAEKAPPVRQGK